MLISQYSLPRGPLQPIPRARTNFIVTKTFESYIKEVIRVVANSTLPILLEGPTSSGKTSLVTFLSQITGYKCLRINNHQNTEIE